MTANTRGPKPRAPWSGEDLSRVAQLFYVNRHSKAEIARETGWSRAMVSKMADEAVIEGLVQTWLVPKVDHLHLQRLEFDLRQKFPHLQEVTVASSHAGSVSNYLPESQRQDVVFRLANLVSQYMARHLHNESRLVVGSGLLIKYAVNSLRLPQQIPAMSVYPMSGFIGQYHHPHSPNAIAANFQQVSSARCLWLPVPATIPEKHYESAVKLPIVKQTLKSMEDANFVVMNVGAVTGGMVRLLVRTEVITNEEMHKFIGKVRKTGKCVGVIDGRLVSEDGEIVETPWKCIGLPFEALKNIIRQQGKVVIVAGGEPRRFKPLLGILQGGLANVLFTDVITAEFLLRQDLTEKRR